MKTNRYLYVFFISIVSLLCLQANFLLDSYKSKKESIQETINFLMRKSVDKEAISRFEKSQTKRGSNIDITTIKEYLANNPDSFFIVDTDDFHEAGGYQHPAHLGGYPFDIHALDSILKGELLAENIPDSFYLIYRDSTGYVIEQSGTLPPGKMKKAFEATPVYIIYGNKAQAVVAISFPTVYMRMTVLTLSSFLIVILLFFCVSFQTRTIYNQKKLDLLKNDFFHSFVHNLKTPLGTIQMVLSKIIDWNYDPQMKIKLGNTAMEQFNEMLILLEKILSIAKIESLKMNINRSITDMKGMINELKERFSLSTYKQVTIHTSVTIDDDQPIHIDRVLIKDAIGNLIDNAIKYSGNQVEININCETIDNTLQIRVADNGYGIPEKFQKRIFKKYERGDAARRNEAKGFGLGLNYVKAVTELHGGVVSLFSQEGEGSEFSLSLPNIIFTLTEP